MKYITSSAHSPLHGGDILWTAIMLSSITIGNPRGAALRSRMKPDLTTLRTGALFWPREGPTPTLTPTRDAGADPAPALGIIPLLPAPHLLPPLTPRGADPPTGGEAEETEVTAEAEEATGAAGAGKPRPQLPT